MVPALAALAALALLAWFFWPNREPGSGRPAASSAVEDEVELERAEREVQEAEDEESIRDWGPGVQKPPLP